MKKLLSLLLVAVMVVGLFAACAPAANNPSTNGGANNPTNGPAPTYDVDKVPEDSERPLRITWNQAQGTNIGRIESPYRDLQSYLPWMLWDVLGESEGGVIYQYVLAESIVPNDDFTAVTLTMKDNVKWQDGNPITVEDVAWTIKNAIANPNSSQSGNWQYVKGYDAFKAGETDELEGVVVNADGTLTVSLSQPIGTFHTQLAGMRPLPSHILGDTAWADVDTHEYWTNPIGSGAYKIKETKYPDYVTLTRWDDYHGEKAGIKNVQFVSFGSGGAVAITTAIATGAIDFADSMALTAATDHKVAASNNSNLRLMNQDATAIRSFVYNLNCREDGKNKAALQNSKVRRAIAMMFDSEGLVELAGGGMTATELMLPTSLAGYNDEIAFDTKLDEATAKAWLTEGGWNFNDTLDIAYYYDDEFTRSMMTYISQCLELVGVKTNCFLLSGDLAALLYQSCNYDIVFLQASTGVDNPAGIYFQLTNARSYTFMAKGDLADAMDAKYAPLMDAYNGEIDFVKKLEKGAEIMALAYEDCYMFPVYVNGKAETYNSSVVYVPEECFKMNWSGPKNWHEWKMLVE